MKKKIILLFVCSFFVLLNGCGLLSSVSYSSPEVLLTSDFGRDSIAVFDFDTDGSGLSSATGRFVADKLTETLFLKGKIKIIDRTAVKKAIDSLSIDPEQFDKDMLTKFGAETDAKYVIVGRLYYSSESDFWNKQKLKRISLSFRIISVSTDEVVGGASISGEYEKDFNIVLEKMINKIVDKMNKVK
jgi:hypothetical protein